MRLTFGSSYLSIHEFPTIEVPSFCLLTGPNGAGKSHFLQALLAGNIRADCAPNQGASNQNEIRFFDSSTLVPQNTGMFASDTLRNERANLLNQFKTAWQQLNILEPLRVFARSNNFDQKFLIDPVQLLKINESEFSAIIGNVRNQQFNHLRTLRDQVENQFLMRFDPDTKYAYKSLAELCKKPLLALSDDDFLSTTVPSWGSVSLFQQSFGRLFVSYRDLRLNNDIREFKASRGTPVTFLTAEEFEAKHGPAPWDFVNESLASANLDFVVNKPNMDDYTSFQPQITKVSSGINIPFANLSSGEKVLMSFAFCVYYSNDKRQLSSFPKVILLDEVDAPLHPSMSKNLLTTIRDSLVNKLGIKVIATTHSPSTVALAPEDSLYAMEPGISGINKSSRAKALNILTIGVPTLSISYDGRRQVFVESPSDAKTYDAVYKLLKPFLASERSLEFVATGTRSAEGIERNTGCEVVERIVSNLVDAGNISVFGLLDWDGKRTSTSRLAILAEGKRNGIENIILDPLIILFLIVRDFPILKSSLCIPDHIVYVTLLKSLEAPLLQPFVDNIAAAVLQSPVGDRVISEYIGGLQLYIDRRYFELDDHALEQKVLDAFPPLRAVSKNRAGALMQHITLTVLTDCTSIIPTEMSQVLSKLLTVDV